MGLHHFLPKLYIYIYILDFIIWNYEKCSKQFWLETRLDLADFSYMGVCNGQY